MPFLELALLALALAMDAFAVATATGLALKKVTWRQTFRLSWHFGLFQALMPMLGWAGGQAVRDYFLRFGHWVAFSLLVIIGVHMLWEGLRHKDEEPCPDSTQGLRLVILSVATSMDALAVGFSLSILQISIGFPSLIIGVTAFFLTALGLHLGTILGYRLKIGPYAEILGGATLMAIGVKILCQALAI